MFNKLDNFSIPSEQDLAEIIDSGIRPYYLSLRHFCEDVLKAKKQIDYSSCTAIPGWNIKYKKSGKSVCTVYPFEDYFQVMITFTFNDLEVFNIVKEDFSNKVCELVETTALFNKTKWLIIDIREENILKDAINLLKIKFNLYNK